MTTCEQCEAGADFQVDTGDGVACVCPSCARQLAGDGAEVVGLV